MADNNKSSSSSRFKNSNLQGKNLYEYFATYSQERLEKFYNHPTICLALFRELPELAHQYVAKLLHVEEPISQEVVVSWSPQTFSREHLRVCKILRKLYVWLEAPTPNGLLGWILAPTFKRNLEIALSGYGKPWSLSSPLDPDKKARDVAFLDAYATERWECVLHYMVSFQKQVGVSLDQVGVLLHAGLMKRDNIDGSPLITRRGFQFVLLERQAQVWQFVLQYLDTAEERGLDLTECLKFLFQLSFSTLGKEYSTEGMSEELLIFLQHLREFGLVYIKKRKTCRFYPTRLALNITNKHQSEDSIFEENRSKGYIIVETNYKVYAYSNSDLQVSLLGLFTDLLFRFPNLVVGRLTQDSVHQALKYGITAEQIIGYLKQHSHSKMSQVDSVSSLPPTVIDQIKLWEMERTN